MSVSLRYSRLKKRAAIEAYRYLPKKKVHIFQIKTILTCPYVDWKLLVALIILLSMGAKTSHPEAISV